MCQIFPCMNNSPDALLCLQPTVIVLGLGWAQFSIFHGNIKHYLYGEFATFKHVLFCVVKSYEMCR